MDPDLNRLVGGDPSWKVLYRQGQLSMTISFWLLACLMGLLVLMGAAMGLGVVAMAISGIAKAGGFLPALRTMWKAEGCGLFVMALLVYLFVKAVRFAWRQMILSAQDRRADPVVIRGLVEDLEEVTSSRGSIYYLTLEGRRMSVAANVFKGVKVGQALVAEIKPQPADPAAASGEGLAGSPLLE